MSGVNPLTGVPLADQDAAQRVYDAVALHIAAHGGEQHNLAGKWMAFTLAEGHHDGVLYDTKSDAIRHQKRSDLCFYVRMQAGGFSLRTAWLLLNFERQLYDAGRRADADAPEIEMPRRDDEWTTTGLKPVKPLLLLPPGWNREHPLM